jgi:hypothetical protein
VQIEQLHSVMRERSAVTRKRTRPQWQPPDIVFGMFTPDKRTRQTPSARALYHSRLARSAPCVPAKLLSQLREAAL